MHNKKVVVIGAGINGLVVANYLKRAGFDVTILEKKEKVGGACISAEKTINGKKYIYPKCASVLGMMQDFVFKETGLSKEVKIYSPKKEDILLFDEGIYKYEEDDFKHSNYERYNKDKDRIIKFLIKGYKNAKVPTLKEAERELGKELTKRWISGNAYTLLKYYKLRSEIELCEAMSVSESSPVSIYEPYSAFSIPLMSSGTIFDGYWGFVRGGIWKITEKLAEINKKLGINIITNVSKSKVNNNRIIYEVNNIREEMYFDILVFGTDPLTASKIIKDENLINSIRKKKAVGTNGKIVMFFKKPVKWKDGEDPRRLRQIISVNSLKEMDKKILSKEEFIPVYFEVYPEGATMRKMNFSIQQEYISVYIKSIKSKKIGKNFKQAKKQIEKIILKHISNPEDFENSILTTPKDIEKDVLIPGGNIEHMELRNAVLHNS